MNLEKAIKIAVEAHTGQVDKGGNPYILHPLRVNVIAEYGGGAHRWRSARRSRGL